MNARPASLRSSLRWLLADRVVRLVATVPVTLLVARVLGPDDFGRLGVALGLAGIGICMAQLGLDRVLRRDLAARPAEAGELVGTAALLALGGAVLAVAAISGYACVAVADPSARRVVLILAWGALPQVLAPAESWFQSAGHPRAAVGARTAVLLVAALARVLGAAVGWPVAAFAGITLAEWACTAVAIAGLFFAQRGLPFRPRFSPAVAGRWLREAWPMFLMLALGAALERFDLLVLQQVAPPQQTGYFAAAHRFSELGWSLSVTAGIAALPWLTRLRESGRASFLSAMQKYLDASMAATVGAALAVTVLAPFALPALLGPQYAPAVPVLIALCWAAPAVYAEVARSQYLLIERKLHVDVAFNLVHAAAGIALCAWSAARWGATGAAAARLAGFALVAWVFPWCVPATREVARMQWRAFGFGRRRGDLMAAARGFLRRPRFQGGASSSSSVTYWRTIWSTVKRFSTSPRAAVPNAAASLPSRSNP